MPILESFIDNSCNFEFNPFPDGEQLKFNSDRRDMMTSPNSWYDDASWRILNMLETVQGSDYRKWRRVAVIKFSRGKCIGKKFYRICVKRLSCLTKLENLEEGRAKKNWKYGGCKRGQSRIRVTPR